MKIAGSRRGIGVQRETTGGWIEAADEFVLQGGPLHAHTKSTEKEMLKCGMIVTAAKADLLCQPFGHHIQFVNIVVDKMKVIAHLVVRGGFTERCPAQPIVHAGQLFAGTAIGLMRGNQRMGNGRRILRHQLQILKAASIAFKQWIGEGFGEGGEKPIAFAGGEIGNANAELLRQCQQNGGGNRALVVFDLVEITG